VDRKMLDESNVDSLVLKFVNSVYELKNDALVKVGPQYRLIV